MQERDMEDIFRDKLKGFEAEHGDRWDQISAALPPEEKKRRFLWIWFSGAGLAIAGFVLLSLYFLNPSKPINLSSSENNTSKSQTLNSNSGPSPANAQEDESSELTNQAPLKRSEPVETNHQTSQPSEKKASKLKQAAKSYTPPTKDKDLPKQNSSDNNGMEENRNPVPNDKPIPFDLKPLEPSVEFLAMAHPSFKEDTADARLPKQVNRTSHPTVKKLKSDEEDLGKWSIGIGGGVYQTKFKQQMPGNKGSSQIAQDGYIEKNKSLREQIFTPGITTTENIWLRYQANSWLSFQTGISMMQSTQNLSFNVIGPSYDKWKAPQDFNEGAVFSGSNSYLFPSDSIVAGNQYTAKSQYFMREVPFSIFLNQKLGKKWGLNFELGASYRWVTSASVYMPDIDNVGMLYLQGADSYPGIRSTWNLHSSFGFYCQLNNYFRLDVAPRMSYSLQSNIRYSRFVQQYQRNWGVELRISRKLGF
ncbi:MAG: hypothetical protein GC180_11090 [Bacteroidetes bacterium]|nr:hypothetical protein [Bacteroidota bacterium]